ncbi:trehalose/maltose transport system permease protein [Hypnocyclicus thermotrophus]|uniref:Trehalose/maltose transport system permease protein n=1 Tax=Hypnocyclicus thermotrophus TaxID=1627895 RepID=A0AA46DXK6_9FUSO|nr:sugar ABC transporter permease [Hypnocyclicus thermotrophus]TDT68061.1 trehalose/maltose transport system permease protein [Hypnocyclicus thermotrophus]
MGKFKKTLAEREQILAYKLLFPSFLIMLLIAAYPLFNVFYTSFTNKRFASTVKTKVIGLKNYQKLLSVTIKKLENENQSSREVLPKKPIRYKELKRFNIGNTHYVIGASDPDFLISVGNTIYFTLWSVLLELIIGLIIALVVNSNFKGKGPMRAIMLVPWAVITVVSARIWEWMFKANRTGLFNTVISNLGLGDGQASFLTDQALQLPAIIAVDVWKTAPFMALLLLAGLQTIPTSLYEAARVDGAGPIRQFFSITLPLLKPTIAVALIFRTLDALRAFDVFQVLLADRRYSMASYNYTQLIKYKNMGMASAIGVIIFIIIFGFAIGYIKFLGVDAND